MDVIPTRAGDLYDSTELPLDTIVNIKLCAISLFMFNVVS